MDAGCSLADLHRRVDSDHLSFGIVVGLTEGSDGPVVDSGSHSTASDQIEWKLSAFRDHVVPEPCVTRASAGPVSRIAAVVLVAGVGEVGTAGVVRRVGAAVVRPGVLLLGLCRSCTDGHYAERERCRCDKPANPQDGLPSVMGTPEHKESYGNIL